MLHCCEIVIFPEMCAYVLVSSGRKEVTRYGSASDMVWREDAAARLRGGDSRDIRLFFGLFDAHGARKLREDSRHCLDA